jgi:glycerate-2-kinase
LNDWSAQHRLIERLFSAGLAAVEPRSAVARALTFDEKNLRVDGHTIELTGRLIVIAIGKAAGPMALGAIDVLSDRIDAGIALTKDGHFTSTIPEFECYEARHPLPDQRGIDATRKIIELVSDLKPEDVVVALISGGGSALLEAPVDGVSLEDFQQTTDLLLKAGAPIQDLNAVRTALSTVKGGGLRSTVGEATCISLILSDVLGNDPKVIASGPLTRPQIGHTHNEASGILDKYGVWKELPASVQEHLGSIIKWVSTEPTSIENDVFQVIADNRLLVDAVQAEANTLGLNADIAWRDVEGEARELGQRFTQVATNSGEEVDVIIGGGEATVTVSGQGSGGRNTEFALASAIELDSSGDRSRIVASLGSDGQDGSADAAGAIADPDSVARGRVLGVSAEEHLQDNDSASYFSTVGGLVQTGPTGTNVNDLYIALKSR